MLKAKADQVQYGIQNNSDLKSRFDTGLESDKML